MTDYADKHRSDGHQAVLELLPWYLNDTLDRAESTRVEAHLLHCRSCRREYERCQDLVKTLRRSRTEAWTPPPGHLQQVMAKIDAFETATATDSVRPPSRFFTWPVLPWFFALPGGARTVFALQSGLLVVLAGLLLWQTAQPPPVPAFQTLTSADPVQHTQPHRVRLVLAGETTVMDLQKLLTEVNAAIVAGPSDLGVYTLALAETADPRAVAERLRAEPWVTLAEPVLP